MKIKKIRARTFPEALRMVRKELGGDAVILSSEDKKPGTGFVEVTAAIDYDIQDSPDISRAVVSEQPPVKHAELHQTSSPDNRVQGDFSELREELKHLRGYIESMKNSGFNLGLPEDRRDMFYFLKSKSIHDEFALKIIERAGAVENIGEVMTDDLNISRPPVRNSLMSKTFTAREIRKIVMLIGPTGVGKTTTIAKLASQAIREGKRVALISIDTYKIGAAEQIRIYARMIGIPLDIVSGTEDFEKSVQRFSDKDLILVDTSGQNPRKEDYIKGLKAIYKTSFPIETHLLLSASSDSDFMMDSHNYYRNLPIDLVGFTKTDEAVRLGSLYNVCRLYQRPAAYITTGQQVPGNLEFIDSRKLTNLILRTGSA